MAGVVRNLVARAGLDISDFEKNISKMQKSLEKTAKKMENIGKSMSMSLTVPILGIAAAGIKTASDLEEVQNVVDVSFGESAKQVDKWAKTTLKAYGLSELSAKKYASTMRALIDDEDLASEEADKMAISLAQLAGDAASFYNVSQDIAFDKLRQGMSGETEGLKQWGINLSVANLELFAMKSGINKTFQEMTEAEKTTLRYNYIMSEMSKVSGDFARTAGSTANQTRLAKEQFLQTSASLMQKFLPAITKLMTKINHFLSWINQLDGGTQTFIMTTLLLVAAIGPLLIMASKVVLAIKVLLPLITAMKLAVTGLNLAFLASPITWIIIGIVALVAAFVILWKKSEAFRDFWTTLWVGIQTGFKMAVNGIIGVINGYLQAWKFMINGTVKILNKLINGLNKAPGVDIPLIPKLGDEALKVPYLAEGGILTAPTLNVAGEAGPEAIIPLSKLDRMLGNGNGGRTFIIINELDGKILSQSVVNNMPSQLRLRGV